MWAVHWGLLLRLPSRAWICPCEGQVWRWYSCLGHRVSGSTRYSGLDSYGSRKYSALEGYGNQYWPIRSSILAWRTPLPDREAWQGTVYRFTMSWILLKQPSVRRCKTFFACGNSAPVRVEREGGAASWLVGILGSTKCAGTWTASTTEVMALSESFFEPLVAGS